jgi:hypothetical protein
VETVPARIAPVSEQSVQPAAGDGRAQPEVGADRVRQVEGLDGVGEKELSRLDQHAMRYIERVEINADILAVSKIDETDIALVSF